MTEVDHYINPLRANGNPKSWIVIAASSLLGGDRSGYSQTWRRASAQFHRNMPSGETRERKTSYDTPERLWADISSWCGSGGLTFLWAHNLQWTARVTGLLEQLPAIGWTLDAFALNPGASWMVWRNGRATLKIADTLSVWPHGIDWLGSMFGLGRKKMPPVGAPWHEWDSYTTRDRDILVRAVASYMWWVEENGLGTLAVTGNSQAWKGFRRRFLIHPILVHHDESLLAMERRAMWTGRCEAYWRGSLLREVVDEWDFTMAHNTIARTERIPTVPHMPIGPGSDLAKLLEDERYAVLAEVEVQTDVPCVPMARQGQICWPTGRFHTVLWSPELRIALDQCRDIRVVAGQLYRAESALKGWAEWVAAHMDAEDLAVPLWAKDILKRWSNILVGRFGMRYPKWRKVGQAPTSMVSAAALTDSDGEDLGAIIQVGHDIWEQAGWSLPRDHAPAITGYVMSAMRARLWRLMNCLPAEALLYVDTDSVLIPDHFRREMDIVSRQPGMEGLRLKRSWDGLSIYGPRQLVTGDSVRVAGLPKVAQRLGRNDFEGEVTESLLEALKAGHSSAVRSTPRQWTIVGEDTRREGTGFGWTKPFTVNEV